MFHIEQTKDKELIKEIISNKEIINGFTEEENIDKYINRINENHIFYLMNYDNNIAGIVCFCDYSKESCKEGAYTVDVGFYKKYRGKTSINLAKICLQEFLNNFNCNLLVATILKNNKPAYVNSRWIGFELIGESNEKYYMRYNHGRRFRRI